MDWQNRITGLEHHTASELMDHAGNWRTHPKHQADALAGVLGEVGIVDALLVYHSKRQGGLTVIDGHLRKGLDQNYKWPCLMTDLDDKEADYILANLDWLTYQAAADQSALSSLLDSIQSNDEAVLWSLDSLRDWAGLSIEPPPSLEDLEKEFGEPHDPDLWPVIRIRVPPETFSRFQALLKKCEGANEAEQLAELLRVAEESI